jgi:hypothetical protein
MLVLRLALLNALLFPLLDSSNSAHGCDQGMGLPIALRGEQCCTGATTRAHGLGTVPWHLHLRGGDDDNRAGEDNKSSPGDGKYVIRQLRCLRDQVRRNRACTGAEPAAGGEDQGAEDDKAMSEEDFHMAQSMLLRDLSGYDECPICLEPPEHQDQHAAVLDGCGHSMCVGCAAKWAKSSMTLSDSASGVSCPLAQENVFNAVACPLCNGAVAHLYVQMQMDGKYLPHGRWYLPKP